MKDGKFESQKEIFEALLRGEKITHYQNNDNYYFYLGSDGYLRNHDSDIIVVAFSYPPEWRILQEPKPKKTIEVKFYRYHYSSRDYDCGYSDIHYMSGWVTCSWEFLESRDLGDTLFKTEERIETYEVENE